jgi:putative hydrolase of the HAD superfamily
MSKKLTLRFGIDTRLKLITLDLDDTLWPCAPVIQAAERAVFDWLAEHAPRLVERHTQETLRAHRLNLARLRPEIAHDLTEVRRESLRQLLAEHGLSEDLAQAASDHFRQHRNRVEPFAEVPAALQRLRPHLVLVSVTNGNAQVVHTPLAGCFHHDLTAAEVGAAKPDPAMFHAALALAAVGPEQALHVGDDPVRDIAAAQAIGIRAVWVNRGGATWPDDLAPPDAEIRDLDGLLGLLGQL